ncbi:protein lin-54 homolog isoform X2 [Drosophila innubila]|uniref:protein lin-54 homolog isoform X2 n=1 Tax=Drosophila innubila TaxID=198719 RepID=UPI00148D68F1|nr:protein lin-54 homolog isoform X2 [Drosophila innubila]
MDTSVSSEIDVTDELDNETPLPELSLYDLLDPPTTSKEQQLNADDNDITDDDDADEDDDDEGEDEEFLSASLNESLNTPKPKKPPIVRILENKRISGPAPIGTALKNMLGGPIRIVTTPTKPTQVTDVKILNKVQAQPLKSFGNTPVRIGSTTIATPAGSSTAATTSKNLGGVTMTQIKTADGKVLFLQKSVPVTGGAASKVPVNTSTTRVVTQSPASGGGIRQTILPKGVTITGAGLIKSGVSGSPIAVRGLTTIGPTKAISSTATTATTSAAAQSSTAAAASPVKNKMPIKVVRTADGKLIKLNQGASPVLLNAKAGTTVAVRAAGSTATTITTSTLSNNSGNVASGNVVISKPTAQVIIKGPLKQLPAGASLRPVISNITSSSSSSTTTGNNSPSSGNTTNIIGVPTTAAAAAATTATLPAGKMLVQSSTGKQIVVASKNIIKLSPKPVASANSNTPATATATATPSGLHAIQLPGKTGVQYVRVLPTNSSNKVSTSPQKVPLGRPRTVSGSNNTPGNSNNNSTTGSVSSTSKIVMKTTVALSGGSIVPLPSMQTFVPRRAPAATPGPAKTLVKSSSSNSSLEGARKHRLSDLNVQIKQLTSESSSSDAVGPDAKKARYVIAMPQTSATSVSSTATTPASQQQMQKLTPTRSAPVQRVTVQGASSSNSGNNNATRKVYNLVTKSDANGVRYMICNKSSDGKPRTMFNTTMRRGYTLADTKLRRPTTLTPQQLRFKQMKMLQQRQVLAQAQAKQRQQQQQKQQQSPQSKTQQQQQQSTSAQANKATVPGKQQFDILRPPPTPAPAATTTIDALGGSRRKHCNCSKSQCLKLYCDCFANGEFCQDCTCKDCFNNLDYEVKRERAIRSCLERNPSAFKPKITAPNSGDMRLHNKGCNCKRSGCLKNYCECYEAKIPCSGMCKCVGCRNMEDRPDVDMDSMDGLVDVKQHANKMKELNGTFPQDNRSNVYLTDDVIEATIMCMISRIVMHEKQNMPIEDTERVVMEELGESLNQIITFAKEKNDTIQTDDPKTTA